MADTYTAADYGKKEEELINSFVLQKDDARSYFEAVIKPRLDRSYKLYTSYAGDRATQIKKWQANVFVPYIHGVIETLKPRIIDARPDFSVQGRNADDQDKSDKVQSLGDYTWEIAEMDKKNEELVSAAMINGTGYLQVFWKKDVRELAFLDDKDLTKKKYNWTKKKITFYDAPYAEPVDNYSLWYDWHNIDPQNKQYWFKRLLLSGASIKRRYLNADPKRLELALNGSSGDLTDYASVRWETKATNEDIKHGSVSRDSGYSVSNQMYSASLTPDFKMHEVFEWYRPLEDKYAVIVNGVPILKKACIPIPFDFKESPFIAIRYLSLPGEFEGIGIPLILENSQLMLNMMKNQRLDATTLNIHKMWIVNPLANINKADLVTRPFGIIWSPDPNGVKEVQFSDIKTSAFQEEKLLKDDMRYASGVDDFSMGLGGAAGSATEVRHLRESTLERVRLFVNHLGDGYAQLLRYWISLWKQFGTKKITIRILGEGGNYTFPVIEKDDLIGAFDFRATVLPSIAGQNEIEKKQNMDLFQLLSQMPFVDPKKLVTRVLQPWRWSLNSLLSDEQPQLEIPVGPDGQPLVGPDGQPVVGANASIGLPSPQLRPRSISPEVMAQILGGPGATPAAASPFAEASGPINLLNVGNIPPTPRGVPAAGATATTNPRGLNMKGGGRVNTNLPLNRRSTPEGQIMNRAVNIQK